MFDMPPGFSDLFFVRVKCLSRARPVASRPVASGQVFRASRVGWAAHDQVKKKVKGQLKRT
jgi:hypothetical protein